MRRFLLQCPAGGFHRIRHYGLLANSNRRDNLALARALLTVAPPPPNESAVPAPTFICAHCDHAMAMTALHHRRPTRRRLRRPVDRFVRRLNTAPERPVAGHCRTSVAR